MSSEELAEQAPVSEPAELTDQDTVAESDELADLDDIDFDLDEVENKIAPLALAFLEPRSW